MTGLDKGFFQFFDPVQDRIQQHIHVLRIPFPDTTERMQPDPAASLWDLSWFYF
jgi:hypothetical protein